jgi:hypothetical protein
MIGKMVPTILYSLFSEGETRERLASAQKNERSEAAARVPCYAYANHFLGAVRRGGGAIHENDTAPILT